MDETSSQNDNTINFSVDAGIVNRLGYELVGKAETAVAELIKNSYDADATQVTVKFIEVESKGGTLVISDDGHGMNYNALENGFMRLSSASKVEEPISPLFKRTRAGRKGIGRFATQRLGTELTILTKTEKGKTLKVNIDWEDYKIGDDLTDVDNYLGIEEVKPILNKGTQLVISNLREKWTNSQIKRVYRYISALLKPDFEFDKDVGKNKIVERQNPEDIFNVSFYKVLEGREEKFEDAQRFLFDNALAIIEGYVEDRAGFCSVKSNHLNIEEETFIVSASNKKNENEPVLYEVLDKVHFKIYYYIHNRPWYYKNISNPNLNNILQRVKDFGSVWVYKNGFRVLPYGEGNNDWLGIEKTRDNVRSRLGKNFNMPIRLNNLAGFVELNDQEEKIFKETASREGLVENLAFSELKRFIYKSLTISMRRVIEEVYVLHHEKKSEGEKKDETTEELLDELSKEVEEMSKRTEENSSTNEKSKEQYEEQTKRLLGLTQRVISEVKKELDEKKMLRVLAALGTSIGEFTHEIAHFKAAFDGNTARAKRYISEPEAISAVDDIKKSFDAFNTYTTHFENIVRKNARLNLRIINVPRTVREFMNIVKQSAIAGNIKIDYEEYDENLYSCPMHESEWHSILFNLFTNSKKAITKRGIEGLVKIEIYLKEEKLVVDFLDNGIGIEEKNKSRVFNAFYTTSNISTSRDEMTGTGLGLKIVKDIISDYKGEIFLSDAGEDFSTCFTIKIPAATQKQINEELLISG